LRDYGFDVNAELLDEWRAATDQLERAPGYPWYREHGGILGLEPYPEWYIAHLVEFLGRLRPCLRPDASVWVNLGDTYFARWSSIRRDVVMSSERWPNQTDELRLADGDMTATADDAGTLCNRNAGGRWILRNDLIWSNRTSLPVRSRSDCGSLMNTFSTSCGARGRRPSYDYNVAEAEHGALDSSAPLRRLPEGHRRHFPA
jgi:site-specific DNA-methyltransferase (adenine-specific)